MLWKKCEVKVLEREKPELKEINGIRQKEGESLNNFEARVEAEKTEKEILALQSEFNNIKSLCLTCTNAIVLRYLPNPKYNSKDPLFVTCKIREIQEQARIRFGIKSGCECFDDDWYRKCLSCSEHKEKKATE